MFRTKSKVLNSLNRIHRVGRVVSIVHFKSEAVVDLYYMATGL